MRIGYGEDAHRLEQGLELWLGGIHIPSHVGAVAHSDGDVILHTISDALLSAFALGDIGALFPDTDPQHKGLDSKVILLEVLGRVEALRHKVQQVSVVVTLDKPKLGSMRAAIQGSLAELLSLPIDRVGVTFKTSEGLALQHVQCRAVVLLHELD